MRAVLVVDDSLTTRAEVRSVLEERDYDVIEAADGQEALDILADNPLLHLVISDLHMPEMSGLEFIKKALRLKRKYQLRIVVLTTITRPNLIRKVRAAGARAWLTKPFKRDILAATVQHLMGPSDAPPLL